MNIVTLPVVTPAIALALDPSSFKLIIPKTNASIASVSEIKPTGSRNKLFGSVMHIEIMPSIMDAVAIIFPLLLAF